MRKKLLEIFGIKTEEDEKPYIIPDVPNPVNGNYPKTQKPQELNSKELEKVTTAPNFSGNVPVAKRNEQEVVEGWTKKEKRTVNFDYGYSFFKPKPIPKKKILVLAIENSKEVLECKESINEIISKIIENNKENFFLVFRTGLHPKCYGINSYDELKDKSILQSIFTKYEEEDKPVLINEVLSFIKFMLNKHVDNLRKIKLDDKTYEVSECNLLFIGCANFYSTNYEASMQTLNTLKNISCVNSIRYFCLKDTQVVNAALVGFTTIGHLETNFYK